MIKISAVKALLPIALCLTITGYAGAKVTVSIAFWGDNAVETQKNMEILKLFEKKTGIAVKPILTTWGEHGQKIITMAASGIVPDLFWLQEVTATPAFANSKIAADLSPFIKRDKSFKESDWFSVALKFCQYRGKQYALPRDICSWMMAYNADILARAGLTPPKPTWTMNDIIAYGKKVSIDADGNGKLEQAGISSYNWMTAVYQFGGELWEDDGSKSRVTDPKVVAGLQWYQDLMYRNHVLIRPGEMTGDPFTSRKAAFTFAGPWHFAPYSQALKFKWDVVNLPVGPTGKSVSELLGQPICLSTQSKHPNEAYQLLKFLTSDPEAQKAQARLGIAMPSIKKLAYSDIFTKAASTPSGVNYYLDALEDTYIQPKFAREPKVRQMLTDGIQPIFSNQKTVEQVLKSIKPSLDTFLGRK